MPVFFEARRLTFRPAPGLAEIRFDVELAAGSAVVIRGPSGCGKTTLLRSLARLRPVDSGELFLEGASWRTIPPRSWRRRVAFAPSKPLFVPGTAEENLRIPFRLKIARGNPYPEKRTGHLLEKTDLDGRFLSRETRVLSDGERTRLGLVRALATGPSVLLADEPTAPLDPESRAAVAACLAEEMRRGLALLAVAHDERLAETLGARIIRLAGGAA